MSETDRQLRAYANYASDIFSDISEDSWKKSYFKYEGAHKTAPYAFGIDEIPNKQTNQSETTFDIGKNWDYIGKTQLQFTLSTLTSDGTYERFVDNVGTAAIERIILRYGSHEVFEIHGEEIYIEQKTRYTGEKEASIEYLRKGGLSIAERDAAATAPQNIILDLPLFFTHHTGNYLPARVNGHELTVIVKWAAQKTLVETDGATYSFSISDPKLTIWHYQVTVPERRVLASRVYNQGIRYLTETHERQEDILNSGSVTGNTSTIKLQNFHGEATALYVMFRLYNDVTGDNLTRTDQYNLRPITSLTLKSGNDKLFKTLTHDEMIFLINPEYFPSDPGELIYMIPFSLHLLSKEDNHGSKALSMFNNLQLTIEWDTDVPSDAEPILVNTIATVKNVLQVKGGQWKRIFM